MIKINGSDLTLAQIISVARENAQVSLEPAARERMGNSRQWVEAINRSEKPVYGINTGFGLFADKKISNLEISKLNRNLILSHAVGVGEPLSLDVVRAGMLVRANTLAKGFSGVRPVVVDTLIAMLNTGVTPYIPSQGSMGSSGDLGPLSHLALVISRDEQNDDVNSGQAFYKGALSSGKAAMEAAGVDRIYLQAKEGLGINNGATFSAAIAALAIYDAYQLLNLSAVTLALSMEALQGQLAAYDARIHESRGLPGQSRFAAALVDLLKDSTLVNSTEKVQDAYSLRCAPQVQGAALDALGHIRAVIEREINAATDNPLLFGEGEAVSGGNFHGEPVALVMDYLKTAVAEIGGISERRIFRLVDGKLNGGLPSMLVDNNGSEGLNSGLMMPQYTAASLVLENQSLAAPDSVHSLPTSGGQEDFNANSMTAARRAYQVTVNCRRILAIELYTAVRALDLRMRQYPEKKPGQMAEEVRREVRKLVPYHGEDRYWGHEVDILYGAVTSGNLSLPNLFY